MPYKPSDSYSKEFVTSSPTTGAATNADSLPVATADFDGSGTGSMALTVTNLDAGRYKVTGTVPAGRLKGDVLNVSVAATVGGVAGKAVVDTQVIDSKRVGDLNDSAYAGADTAGTTTLVNRLTSTRATNLDNLTNLDVPVSGRMATFSYTVPPSLASITTGVWDQVTSGHTTSGTFGAAMNAAGSAGDPWATTLPGAYGVGTAGYAVGHNLDAQISTRSTYAGGAVASVTGNVGGSVASIAAGGIASASFAAGATIPRVTLADTLTTYTGNTVQSGDAYARIGAPVGASLSADIQTRSTYAGGAVASVTGNVGGSVGSVASGVTVTTNNDKTGYSLATAPPTAAAIVSTLVGTSGLTIRTLDAVADSAITIGDCLVAAVCGAAGKESVVGTAYTIKTPSTGTVIRTFTLDSGSAPTSRN